MQINSAHMQNLVTMCELRTDRQKCTDDVLKRQRGAVNYMTLKGISLYKNALDIVNDLVPSCAAKYEAQIKITTIPKEYRKLCDLVPDEW